MEVSYSSFRVKAESDSLLLGRWEKWKSRGSCGISKRSGKVLPLDFSAERLFPPPFYPRIVLKTQKTEKLFSPNIRGVFSGTRFYEVDMDGTRVSQEEALSEIETDVGPVFEQLVQRRRLRSIGVSGREKIASFCAVQLVRTQTFRDQIKDIIESTAQALERGGTDPSQVQNFENLTDTQIKQFSMEMLADAPKKYGPYFLSKFWHLIGGDAEDTFHLGENPVVLDNDLTGRNPGSLGLASPGVTIYLPISSTLCLAMTDSRLIAKLYSDARQHERLVKKRRKLFRKQTDTTAEDVEIGLQIKKYIDPFRLGVPCEYNQSVTMRVNSLQMLYAGRWIVSSKPNFSLPLKMIADDPSFRDRQRIKALWGSEIRSMLDSSERRE